MKRTMIWLALATCMVGLLSGEGGWFDPQTISFRGISLTLGVEVREKSAIVYLRQSGRDVFRNDCLAGENICPAAHIRGDRLFITWIRYSGEEAAIALWSWHERRVRLVRLPGFKFVGSPQILFVGQEPAGIVFLGNRQGNDDLFAFDLSSERLTQATTTPWSEKGFQVEDGTGQWFIVSRSLKGTRRLVLGRGQNGMSAIGLDGEAGTIVPQPPATIPCIGANAYIAFGDSITAGKMRMNDLPGYMYPNLAYPAVMEKKLLPDFGQVYFVNEGISGIDTLLATDEIDAVLGRTAAGFFLLMLGTNDCINNEFSVDSSLENLEYLIDHALAAQLKVIVSTIPPRKDFYGSLEFVLKSIDALNQGIRTLAAVKKDAGEPVALADTHQAFMDYSPPEGWRTLLEDRGGNHPSPKGHEVIADLFIAPFKAFPPKLPEGVNVVAEVALEKQVAWDANCESDLDHYTVELGFSPGRLSWNVEVKANAYTFHLIPPLKTIYFRLRAVDKYGNSSPFSPEFRAGSK